MGSEAFSSFGENLRAIRRRQGLTQQQVADQLGVHRNTISTWERGEYLPDSKGIVLELARLLQLDEQETRQLLEASLTALAPYWSVPYACNSFFTGREEILEELHRRLGPERAIALAQSYAMYGLGGIGKTQIALEYAYRYALEYSAVFWIGAETAESIMAGFLHLAAVLQLPERDQADQQRAVVAVQRWFSTHKDWLLIWDNLEDLELLARFLPAARQGAILITTRLQAFGPLAQGIELETMAPEEGILFLLRRARVLAPEARGEQVHQLATSRPTEYAAARDLVTLLGELPLALDQAGAYIEETGCDLSAYVQQYEQQRARLLDRRGFQAGEHPQSVTATFLMAMKQVERDHPAAADLLRLSTFLHPEAIPEELFVLSAPHLGSKLAAVAADPLQLDLALTVLRTFSLIQRHPETRTISLHRLVQAVMRDHMEAAQVCQWMEGAVRVVNAAFPEPTFAVWPQCERLMPQVQACRLLLEHRDMSSPEAGRLSYAAGSYLLQRGRYAEAESYFLQALAIREQQYGTASPEIAATLNFLGWTYWNQGEYAQAEPCYQRALRIYEQQAGQPHPERALSLNNLATLYTSQGRYEEAEPLYRQALNICEQQGGLKQLTVAGSLNNLALLYHAQGRYGQAAALLRRAVSLDEQQLEPEYPDAALRLNNLARVYWAQGRYAGAEALCQQAARIFQQQLGSEHPEMATSLSIMARVFWSQGRLEEAEALCQQVARMYQHQRGPEHPYTTRSLNNLAMLYVDQGKYKQAEPLFLQVLTLRERLWGPAHFETAESFHSLAVLYEKQGKEEQAESLFLRALTIRQERLGPAHPDTARSVVGLARLYQKQGREEQAESLFLYASQTFEQRLGQEHPETVQVRNDHSRLLERKNRATHLSGEEQREPTQPVPGSSCQRTPSLSLFPQSLQAAAAQETDPLAAFLAACCELHPRAWSRSADLWRAYERWVAGQQERFPLSRRAFATQLKGHGCRADRTKTARIWRGITLVHEAAG